MNRSEFVTRLQAMKVGWIVDKEAMEVADLRAVKLHLWRTNRGFPFFSMFNDHVQILEVIEIQEHVGDTIDP